MDEPSKGMTSTHGGFQDRRWSSLVETIEGLSSVRTIEEVVALVRKTARRIAGADGVTFVRREGSECYYIDEDAIAPLWKGRRFRVSECISGWCMSQRQTAVIPDIYADPRISAEVYQPTFVRSLVMVPVRVEDPLAAIGSYWATQRHPDDDEIAVLEALARSTATALANVELYEKLTKATVDAEQKAVRLSRMIDELNHRVNNTLTTVQSVAIHSFRSAGSAQEFYDAFMARLHNLSDIHSLLRGTTWEDVLLSAIIKQTLAPYATASGVRQQRFELTGADFWLAPTSAAVLGMVFHELATNAAKYGALSVASGTVAISSTVDRDSDTPVAVINWAERGGPPLRLPDRTGFGTRLIEYGMPRELHGEAVLSFLPSGLECCMRLPLSSGKLVPA